MGDRTEQFILILILGISRLLLYIDYQYIYEFIIFY